jgi:membrane-bound lytic murein transglycosylase A
LLLVPVFLFRQRPPDDEYEKAKAERNFQKNPEHRIVSHVHMLHRPRLRGQTESMRSVGKAVSICAVLALFAGCAAVPSIPPQKPVEPAPLPEPVIEAEPVEPPVIAVEPVAPPPEPVTEAPTLPVPLPPPAIPPAPVERIGSLIPAAWESLPDWRVDEMQGVWSAFLLSCKALRARAEWQRPCWAATELQNHDPRSLRQFFETHLRPYAVRNDDGSDTGMVTGYYEPLLRGSRLRAGEFQYPLYGVPEDLLVVELGDLFPQLQGQRVRGRVEGRRVVPYFTREEIEAGRAAVQGRELLWVDDPVELFFLHVQGSGRVQLNNGETVRVGYADHNGHPYRSIGRLLIERGELTLDKASMQGIKAWGRDNPDKLPQLLAENPAYVFFRKLPDAKGGPIGALGVPVTPGRSIAVDPRAVPLGAPVYLSTTWPLSSTPLNRLMLAQDTGSAIKGAVRADFFWGFGDEAARQAGRMRQNGRMWVLLPKDAPVPPR